MDFATNTIYVRHSLSYTKANDYQLKEPKTKGSVRKIAPPRKLMDELQNHIHQKRQEKMAAAELWDGTFGDLVFSTSGLNKKNQKNKLELFGKPLHLNSPNRWWTRFINRVNKELKKEDKPILKKIRFHDLRHCAATDLINKGG